VSLDLNAEEEEMQLWRWRAELGVVVDCEVLVLVFGFDEGDRPAAGTACAGCRLLGHWCPAKGMCGETALCLSCGRGEVCGQALSVEKMRSGLGAEMFEAEVGCGSGECRTIAIADADRVVEETAAVSDWAIKASLDPENLKRGLKGRQPAPLLPRTQKERKAANVKKPRGPRGPYAKTKLEAAMGMKKTKRKPEEVVMATVETKRFPASRHGRVSPFQAVYDQMFQAFEEGKALMVELESFDVVKIVEKACRVKARKGGFKVRTSVDGPKLWLQATGKL
jgi:hypothetical protein